MFEKKTKIYIYLVILLLCLLNPIQAQQGWVLPYSQFGVGALQPNLNVKNMGMGGISVGLSGRGNATPFNPASYSFAVDSQSVVFDIGLGLMGNNLSQEIQGQKAQNQSFSGTLSNLGFYFPIIKQWWSMGAFLLPLTEMSYFTSKFAPFPYDTFVNETQQVYSGNGGLHKVGWGNSFSYKNVALGVNLNYLFGSFFKTNAMYFWQGSSLAQGYANTEIQSRTYLRGLGVDLGVTYVQALPKKNKMTIGLAYTFSMPMTMKYYASAKAIYQNDAIDTVFTYQEETSKIRMPASIRAGLSYETEKNWLIAAEFNYTNWSSVKIFDQKLEKFENTWEFSLGAELKSDMTHSSFARRMAYRIGGRYGNQYVDYENKQLTEFGVSVGVGIPIRRSRSFINIAVEGGRSGQYSKGQIQSDFIKIGLSFSSIETWFVKRKYD